MTRNFYEPSPECIAKLSGDWCCSYSGGKDSTSLLTWVMWLLRTGQLKNVRPRLVRSDTGVEDPALIAIADAMTEIAEAEGWECGLVRPLTKDRLYNQILGRGLPPIHPGARRVRWCTRSTKVDPMKRWHAEHSGGFMLTGMRFGESKMRDGKLATLTCVAGGECGIPPETSATYSPIVQWKTCNVIDWLSGLVHQDVQSVMADVLEITRKLVDIYEVSVGQEGFQDAEGAWVEPDISTARFGCVGCPAISAGRAAPKATFKRNGPTNPLNELYDVWFVARQAESRVVRLGTNSRGPIKMAVRKELFERVADIQKRSGVVLMTREDKAFIRKCWRDKVYPRGWSVADEANEPTEDRPILNESA